MMKMITENLKFADIFPEKAAEFAQRLHIKKDEIPFVRKFYTAEKDKTEVKKKERAVVSYISTGIKDRDGEKLIPEGVLLDNYLKNPVVPFAHNYKSIPPAKNMWIKRDEKGLVAKTVFAKSKSADEYYQAYTEDVGGTGPLLNAFSVGFIPLEWEDTEAKAMEKDPDLPKRIYNKWELLEYSLVPIPSCAEALTIAQEKGLYSEKLLKELEIEVVKDVEDKEIEVELKTSEPDHSDETDGAPEEKEIEIFDLEEETANVSTKPETTDKYHRIPVNPGCEVTATITISADQGIKAIYCGGKKVVHTYLFDVNKWTMAEAKKWVEDHKGIDESIQKEIDSQEEMKSTVEEDDKETSEESEVEEEAEEEEEEKQEKYKCECIKCGHKLTSEKHCNEIKCPECGGTMRRVERPGPGQEAVSEETDALRDDVSDELDEPKGDAIEDQQGGGFLMREKDREEFEIATKLDKALQEGKERPVFTPNEFRMAIDMLKASHKELIQEKDDHIADLKEGRVLSRKHRDIVKAAITALNAVLKADATGTQEDEDDESGGTVTEREIDIVKDDEKVFDVEDIKKIIKEVSGPAIVVAIENAFKKFNPEEIKKTAKEEARLALQEIRGKVE